MMLCSNLYNKNSDAGFQAISNVHTGHIWPTGSPSLVYTKLGNSDFYTKCQTTSSDEVANRYRSSVSLQKID